MGGQGVTPWSFTQHLCSRGARLPPTASRRMGGQGVTPVSYTHLNVLTLFNLLNLCLAGLLLWVGSHRDMLFLGVVLSNTLIGTIQELRAKRTHDRLQLLSEGRVRVMRDGVECRLSPQELVLDDVVLLSRGDQIPADATVLSGAGEADESLLTGESAPVSKAAGDTLYSGSFLVSGSVAARLTAVGADSYAGQLQLSARRVKRAQSELMRDMRRIKMCIRDRSICRRSQ